MQTINLYLLRHGEITAPQSLAGHTDFAVTDDGLQQMADAISDLQFGQCFTSPLQRCKSFAQHIKRDRGISVIECEQIKEMHFGDWDGLPYEQLWQMTKPNIGDFWQSPYTHTPPNGESFPSFCDRVEQWWLSMLPRLNKDALIVTHAGVIKAILALLLAKPQEPSTIEHIVTTTSVGYGHLIHLIVYQEQGCDPKVQIKL